MPPVVFPLMTAEQRTAYLEEHRKTYKYRDYDTFKADLDAITDPVDLPAMLGHASRLPLEWRRWATREVLWKGDSLGVDLRTKKYRIGNFERKKY